MDFRDQLMALAMLGLLATLSAMTQTARPHPPPSATALMTSARDGMKSLFSENVWPWIVEGMGSDASPWSLDVTPDPRAAGR